MRFAKLPNAVRFRTEKTVGFPRTYRLFSTAVTREFDSRDGAADAGGILRASISGLIRMLEAHARAGIRNRLLHKIAPEDWDLIGPHLEAITLKERQVIEVPGKPITHAYFMEIGVVVGGGGRCEDHRIEVGVIGYEGITGVPLIMGDNRAQHSTYMQIAGNGHRIAAGRSLRGHRQKRDPARPDAEIGAGLHDPDGAYRAGQWPRQAGSSGWRAGC